MVNDIHWGYQFEAIVNLTLSRHLKNIYISGVAKSQKCILVHGQVVLKKHLSVPMHYLSILLQIQMQVFKNGIINKIMIKQQFSCLSFC